MNREGAKNAKEELRRDDDAFDAFFEDGDVEVDRTSSFAYFASSWFILLNPLQPCGKIY